MGVSTNFTILDIAIDRPINGCPFGTIGCDKIECPKACFCEDHCSWNKCKLENPPVGCLGHSNRKWEYDEKELYWKTTFKGRIWVFSK